MIRARSSESASPASVGEKSFSSARTSPPHAWASRSVVWRYSPSRKGSSTPREVILHGGQRHHPARAGHLPRGPHQRQVVLERAIPTSALPRHRPPLERRKPNGPSRPSSGSRGWPTHPWRARRRRLPRSPSSAPRRRDRRRGRSPAAPDSARAGRSPCRSDAGGESRGSGRRGRCDTPPGCARRNREGALRRSARSHARAARASATTCVHDLPLRARAARDPRGRRTPPEAMAPSAAAAQSMRRM